MLACLLTRQAHLFYVPLYLSSLFMWPIVKFADEPYYGRETHENRRRSHQGALLMLRALSYIRSTYPFWNASAGADHVWMMLHDEGPCFCPAQIRASILLTHYGYYASPAKVRNAHAPTRAQAWSLVWSEALCKLCCVH